MLDRLTSVLARHPEVNDWTVRRRRSRSVQLYLIGTAVESVREVATEEYELDVFNDHPYPAQQLDLPGPIQNPGARPSGRSAIQDRGAAR